MRKGLFCIVIAVSLVGIASLGVRAQERAIRVRLCDFVSGPVQYDKKLITVRARVAIRFENFSLISEGCPSTPQTQVWLEFGGDVESPTIYCCGDHSRKRGANVQVEGIEIPITKDAHLKRLLTILKQLVRRPRQQPIEATITGRFFAGEATKDRNGDASYVGYGHMGQFSLLVIQKAVDLRLMAEP